MNRFFLLLFTVSVFNTNAQVNCEVLRTTGATYSLMACKNGTGKLYNTDTALTNKFKYRGFNLKLVSELSPEEKAELKKTKIKLNQTDTVMFYDWDILQSAKMGYFGPAIGRVHINAKDSVIKIQKFFLKPTTMDYVPTRFKIIRMGQDNFIFYDIDHPYLNINYYFKKKVVFTNDK
ncbi:MAG: hypothetical protein SGJ15_11385 [Bacteroidota bacterium]|nr:hypothetical protein [Bacteroidota bacterium]